MKVLPTKFIERSESGRMVTVSFRREHVVGFSLRADPTAPPDLRPVRVELRMNAANGANEFYDAFLPPLRIRTK